MKIFFRSLLVRLSIILIFMASAAEAAIVDGLYEAEILVQSQSRSERDQAMSKALAQVFQKVSGRSNAQTLPGIADAISNADRYLQQYLYRGQHETQYPIPQADPDSQLAWFRFDEQAVNGVLRDNNLPVWGRTRPATLVWLGVEQNGSRYMLGSDSAEELRDLLEYEAQRQGMALVLPLLDLQDQRTLSFADLWGNFQDSILNASSRYQAEAVLVGRISLSSSDVWLGRWTLYESGRNVSWQSQGTYPDEVLSTGVAGTVEKLADVYAQSYSGESPGAVLLAVTGVTSLKDYARVTTYLKSLELVKDIQPTTITNDSARFRLSVRGNAESLAQTIKLGSVLQEEQITIESQSLPMNPSPSANFFGMSSPVNDSSQTQSPDYTYRLMP
jgi:hypothetical protein